jgi:hypothetical protein
VPIQGILYFCIKNPPAFWPVVKGTPDHTAMVKGKDV